MKATALLLLTLLCFGLASCSSSPKATPAIELKRQTVTVGCGMCIYQLPNSNGCYWAAEVDGQHFVVQGDLPKNHENHAPDGMCNMSRRAVIDGTLEGNRLFAKRFELLDSEAVPETPSFTPADIH